MLAKYTLLCNFDHLHKWTCNLLLELKKLVLHARENGARLRAVPNSLSCTTTAFAFYLKFVPSISSFFIFFFAILKNGERIYAYDY